MKVNGYCVCVCFVRKYRTLCIKYYYHYYALLKIFINASRKGSAMKLFWSLVQIMSTCACIKYVLGNKNKNENKKNVINGAFCHTNDYV